MLIQTDEVIPPVLPHWLDFGSGIQFAGQAER